MGVAKNCGKTTTLTALLRRRDEALPGLLSIGVDGEEEDVLLGTNKPPIRVNEGQWVVTARQCAEQALARLEYVMPVGIDTPLGEVYVCEVKSEGGVVLAGLRQRGEVEKAMGCMRAAGVEAVWLDGAYGRVSGAHPALGMEVVLCTGAIAGATLAKALQATGHLYERFVLSAVGSEEARGLVERAEADRRVYVRHAGEVKGLASRSALLGLKEVEELGTSQLESVAIPGLISDRVAEELLSLAGSVRRELLVPDGTVFHLKERLFRRLRRRWDIQVLRPIQVVGVSVNPTRNGGEQVPAEEFRAGVRDLVGDEVVVFDPLSEE